ncbi:hypothetical protein ACJX0J_022502 [Zea mays]
MDNIFIVAHLHITILFFSSHDYRAVNDTICLQTVANRKLVALRMHFSLVSHIGSFDHSKKIMLKWIDHLHKTLLMTGVYQYNKKRNGITDILLFLVYAYDANLITTSFIL